MTACDNNFPHRITGEKCHHPVQILKHNKNTKQFELDLEVLRDILNAPDVRHCNIGVISIAGAFRKGKSFVMNFFLRYLQTVYENNIESDWMGDGSAILEGFEWRGGSKRHTTGIWIWSKIFTTTRANGERIGVMLMDTQGISSKESTVNEDISIFSFSTILSSVQIFNLFNNIQEDDLQNLQLYTEYARRSIQQNSTSESLQKLLFLIRDWNYPYEASYGLNGGRQILEMKLKIFEGQDAELCKVRDDLKSAYTQIECCLMPHISSTATSQEFRGQLKDLNEDFKDTLKTLVEHLLHPDNVSIKTNNGEQIKVQEFSSYIELHFKTLMTGEVKMAKTISSTTAEVNILASATEAMTFYNSEMEKNTKSDVEYKILEDMNKMNGDIASRAIEIFDRNSVLGDEQVRQKHRKKLLFDINEKYQLYLGQNEGKRVKSLSAQKDLLLSQLESYKKIESQQMDTIQALQSQAELERLNVFSDKNVTPGSTDNVLSDLYSRKRRQSFDGTDTLTGRSLSEVGNLPFSKSKNSDTVHENVEFKKLKADMENLKKEKDTLREENERLQKENERLRKENKNAVEKLKIENKSLSSNMDLLMKDNAVLRQHIEGFKIEYERMSKEREEKIRTQSEQISTLLRNQEHQKNQLQEIIMIHNDKMISSEAVILRARNENIEMRQAETQLLETIANLKAIANQRRQEIKQLNDKEKRFKNEIQRLKAEIRNRDLELPTNRTRRNNGCCGIQ